MQEPVRLLQPRPERPDLPGRRGEDGLSSGHSAGVDPRDPRQRLMRLSVKAPAAILAIVTDDHIDARVSFEQRVDSLRGRRVLSVGYWDLIGMGPDTEWDFGDWHHAVMGVQLTTDAGPVTVTWTATFYPYGVEVFLEPIDRHVSQDVTQRVGPSTDSRWTALLGQPVRDARVSWDRITVGPATRSNGQVVGRPYDVDVPTALRLDFDGGPVWFVAGMPEFPNPERAFIPGDEIMVVFTASKMRQLGYTDPSFTE